MSDIRLVSAAKIENYALPALLRKHPARPPFTELKDSAGHILRDLFSVYNEEDVNALLNLAAEEYTAQSPTLSRRQILKTPRNAMTSADQLRAQIAEAGKKADQFVIEHGTTISNIALGVAGVMRSYGLIKQIVREAVKLEQDESVFPQKIEIED